MEEHTVCGGLGSAVVRVAGALLATFYYIYPTVGLVFVMIAFGAAFGYTVMSRISLLIGRAYFLFHDWLGLI